MTKTLRIALLFGGKSVEHEISLRSVRNVYEQLDRSRFEPVLLGITKQGSWHLLDSIDQPIGTGDYLNLSLGDSEHTFTTSNGNSGTGKLDLVFPVLHGTDGEDGSVQGLLQTADIPFAGSGVLGSSVSMDKHISKQLLVKENIPTSKYLAIKQSDLSGLDYKHIVEQIGSPFIVKPISLGSSVGVAKIKNEGDFNQAVTGALRYDQGFLAEEFIQGRELECAVLGNQMARSSDPGEIIISPRYEFYSYDAKYQDPDAVEIKIPADLKPATRDLIKKMSLKAYKTLGCEDFARVDLFLKADESIYINEINTIPGFTNSSMFPSLWAQHGISFSALITQIIDLAMERYEMKKKLNRDYRGTAIN
ncbi:MAG: D-alanine--D-alanine ligase [Cyclobacteriaceae bacterium]|nr:MAG: D-alanine--D-alanine ligase [Cyclobacteriaceae bacterium]